MSAAFLDAVVHKRELKRAGRSVAAELVRAEESQRALDLMGRALVTITADDAAALAESAYERACIQAEPGAAVAGLVIVPTSDNSGRNDPGAAAAALKKRLSAVTPDQHRQRIAKLRRSVGFAARGHLAERRGFRPDTVFMITATYELADAWRPLHVSAWLKNIREWCRVRRLPCRYVWVAELQKRGAIHYHVALWLPAGVYLPDSDACGWWPHGTTRTERARGAVQYLMKYLSKGAGAGAFTLPRGARMYGVGGLEYSLRRAARWLRYPAFVRARADINDDWRRAPGGGWADPSGTVIPSEYQRAWIGDAWGCVRVVDYGRPFDASGPFSWVRHA